MTNPMTPLTTTPQPAAPRVTRLHGVTRESLLVKVIRDAMAADRAVKHGN